MRGAVRWIAAVGCVALLLWAIVGGGRHADAPAARLAWPGDAAPPAATPAHAAAARTAPLAAAGPRDPAAFERWMTERSSLRGAVLDGAWDVDAEGRLHTTLALRRRFDHLLSLLGEATLDELHGFIAYDVEGLAGPAAAQRVLAVWQRYLALQQHAFRVQPVMHDRGSWASALAERQQVRRQMLGPEIAAAFYADDERQLQALIQGQAAAPAATAAQAIERSELSPQALDRLRAEEAAWADWERRLADARRELAALNQRAELSPLQRGEWMERFIAQRFDAGEALRVRALLQLPGA